jgi:DNA-binding MarR family transcriptional regulator
MTAFTQADFEHLLQLRTGLRRFLRWSERQSRAAGLTPAHHQLLLAIKGHPDPAGPTVGDIADYLLLQHHSAVGLIDRAAAAGLVKRDPDPTHNSTVRLSLTPIGAEKLNTLTDIHRDELSHLTATMHALWQALEAPHGTTPHPAAQPTPAT